MKKYILSLGTLTLLMSCSTPQKENKTESTESVASEAKIVTEDQSSALSDYLTLKDALVQTDASAAKSAGNKLVASATAENWSADMVNAAEAITSSDDVEAQRTSFKTVTAGLIAALKANGTEDGVYVQYCPMAFKNTGASWISASDQIRNPYFGDKMLKCGKVTEEL